MNICLFFALRQGSDYFLNTWQESFDHKFMWGSLGAISEYPATFERHNSNAPVVPQSLSENAILCYARSSAVPL